MGRDTGRDIVRLDEVNFWQPRSQARFQRLRPGAPFFLRLKAPDHAIAGFGFFAAWHLLPLADAWRDFGPKNGAESLAEFVTRIGRFRADESDVVGPRARPVGCIILTDVHLLPRTLWVPWRDSQDWHLNNQRYVGFEDGHPSLPRLFEILRLQSPDDYSETIAEFSDRFTLVECDQKTWRGRRCVTREGQVSFRMRLLDAYGGRCALTGERTVPVLEAAHIQPYLGRRSNHVQNGLLLRADLHDLYDDGYITVVPRAERDDELVIEVSDSIREQWSNGRIYYDLRGRSPAKLPDRPEQRPSREALLWHKRNVFVA